MAKHTMLSMASGRRSSPEQGDSSGNGIFRNLLSVILFRTDWLQILPMMLLITIGELFIYGTGQQIGGFYAETFWKRHLIYIGIGIAVWLIFSILDYRWCGPFALTLYPLSIALLIYVLFWGEKYFGARSWIQFGSINFQPSEVAKFSLLVLTAWILSMKKVNINRLFWLVLLVILTMIPVTLTKMQPDLGTATAMLAPVLAIIFTARLKWRYILILSIIAAICMPVGYYFLKDYQKERIRVFLDPSRDPSNRGWSTLQAEMAVGSGGLTGKGFMKGTHNLLGFLPQKVSNSDFIFPVIAEETGFLGATGVVLTFMILLFSILRTALLAPDDFGKYMCVGIAILMFFHTYVNIAMCLRLCPVTGLPLPLVSYGGTFLVTTMAYLGIVHSVYGHREKKTLFDL